MSSARDDTDSAESRPPRACPATPPEISSRLCQPVGAVPVWPSRETDRLKGPLPIHTHFT